MFNSKGNSEISRLRDEMNHLFEQKQAAYDRKEAAKRDMLTASKIANSAYDHRRDCAAKQNQLWRQMESAWREVEQARDAMNSAFDRAKSSRDGVQTIWDEAKQAMNDNNRRIDDLKSQADSIASDMHNAFDNASSAWNNHDGASAKEYSEEGHRLQDELRGINAEVSSLINENKCILANAKASSNGNNPNRDEFARLRSVYNQAKARHTQIKANFERAKADFEVAKAEHEKLNADYHQKKAIFESARVEFQRLNQQFKEAKAKYDKAKEQHKSSTDDIARKAGIPSKYLDDVIIKEDAPGCYSIYFGGAGSPDGPGHGHYVLDNGSVTYHRDPYEPHGSQNYDDYKDSLEFRNYQSAAERSEEARKVVSKDSGNKFVRIDHLVMIPNARSQHSPTGISEHGKDYIAYDRNRPDGARHVTQYYPEEVDSDGKVHNYHVSWDTDENGTRNIHWDDTAVAKGSKNRHKPPKDATI